jgi:menaquinone-dependent protoporphyrinogen oxidase
MSKRVLVAYASEFGSTADVAETIGYVLRQAGAEVEVQPVVAVSDLGGYDAAIVGSAIYNGQWLPEASYFVQFHADALSRMPVAYFVVCMTVRDDTDENRRAARSFLDPVLAATPQVQPVGIGLFAGSIETDKLPIEVRVRMWLTTKLRHGDYRNWQLIRAWALEMFTALTGQPAPESLLTAES